MHHVDYQLKNAAGILSRIKTNVILVLILSVVSICATAQNFTVNSNGDTHAVSPASSALDGSGQITLRSAMEASTQIAGSHVITIPASITTINLTLGQITVGNAAVGNNITLNGPGKSVLTINQTTVNRVFFTGLGAVTFSLNDLTLNYTGPAGTISGGGGAIQSGGINAVTSLTNVAINNFNIQAGNGGAISCSTSNTNTFSATNCDFNNNYAGGGGGAVSYNGNATCTITNCRFTNNRTGPISGAGGSNTGGSGGALSTTVSGNGGVYTVSGCTFTGNQALNAAAQGGAVINTNGSLTASFSRFIGNTAATPAFGNTFAQTGGSTVNTINTNNNWWGLNSGPAANDNVVLAAGGTITCTKWLQLKTSFSPISVCVGGTTVFTAGFLSNSAGEVIAAGSLSALVGLPISFVNPVLGSLSGAQATIQASGTATVTYTAGGTGGTGSVNAVVDNIPNNDVAPATSTVPVSSLDYVNLQWPPSATLCDNGALTAYGQVYEAGVTEPFGPGTGIVAELGYHTLNTNPSGWTNWIPATYNTQGGIGNNNDEYMATLPVLPAGTYYYTFRYKINDCGWQYGGYSGGGGGTWNGTGNNSGLLTVNANFTITASAGANGSITPNGVTTLSCEGTGSQSYTITANAGFVISDVIVDGISQGAIATYNFNNVTSNHTISASFAQNAYTINATAGTGGSISPGGNTSVNSGSNQTYSITASNCYSIADVVVDGISQGAIPAYTFTNVQSAHTIVASFTQNGPYTITVTAGANGSITPGTGSVACGSNAAYTITPASCYSIASLIVDGSPASLTTGSLSAGGTYVFTDVQAPHSISATFALNAPFPTPGPMTGIINVCQYVGTGTQLTYSVPAIPGATSYQWVVPPTVTIVSGQGTNSIVITANNGFIALANKQLRVTALSSCGNSPQAVFFLHAQLPTTPSPIVASTTNICPSIGTNVPVTYTIPRVTDASSYIWTAQAGTTTITSINGPGVNDTSVTVTFSSGFTTSAITVRAVNDCGTTNVRSFTITRNNLGTPALINGPTNACPYIAPNGTPAAYNVAPVANATGYNWTVPAGSTGLTGQGTNSISFIYPAGFTSGTVTVTASNGCGVSATRSLSVGTLNPSAPGLIDVQNTATCPNRLYTYTIATYPVNASDLVWTAPAGATIVSGQGTTSITVSYPGTAVNGTVTVQAVNNCGVSVTRVVTVKLPACPVEPPPPFAATNNPTVKGNVEVVAEPMNVNVYPNPTTTDFKLQVITAGKEEISVRVLDMAGRFIKQVTVMPYQTINIGAELKAGSYMIEVRQGLVVKTTRVIKF